MAENTVKNLWEAIMEKKEISELFDQFTNEPDKEKRYAMIDSLTEEQAKLILKSIADFKYRTSPF